MTADQIIKAIDVAAQARVSRCFDVLCAEIITTSIEAQDQAVQRFMNGIAQLKKAHAAAIDAVGGRVES